MQRRAFIASLGYGLSIPAAPTLLWGQQQLENGIHTQVSPRSYAIFDSGVASGDPSPSGVILWTRIHPDLFQVDCPLWIQVAKDQYFRELWYEAPIATHRISEDDYTVRVNLDGALEPDSIYYYRFVYDTIPSPVGRCRTTGYSAKPLKIAVLTCQDMTTGNYGAFRHLSQDTSIDFVVHLGDFIYEKFPQQMGEERATLFRSPHVACTLDDYRLLYRLYRRNPHLQAAMQQHTWICSWDDHETANDCYWDYERDTLGAPDHPFNKEHDTLALRQLKLDAQKAWSEYVPSRTIFNANARHPHDALQLYRSCRLNQLVQLSMLDTRTYRTAHPCGMGVLFERYLPLGCQIPEVQHQSMLGEAQRQFVLDQWTESDATWNVLGNQTCMSPLAIPVGRRRLPVNMDGWDGYRTERDFLWKAFAETDKQNLIVLTGDMHAAMVSHIAMARGQDQHILGMEFMTPSVTSRSLMDRVQTLKDTHMVRKVTECLFNHTVQIGNPHIHYLNPFEHGYGTVTFHDNYCDMQHHFVDKRLHPEIATIRQGPVFRYHRHRRPQSIGADGLLAGRLQSL